jgi:hypothetical protein
MTDDLGFNTHDIPQSTVEFDMDFAAWLRRDLAGAWRHDRHRKKRRAIWLLGSICLMGAVISAAFALRHGREDGTTSPQTGSLVSTPTPPVIDVLTTGTRGEPSPGSQPLQAPVSIPGLDPSLIATSIPALGHCNAGQCPSLAEDSESRIVHLDPIANTITVAGVSPLEARVAVPLGAISYIAAVGPGNVAYLVSQTESAIDPVGDILAVSLSPVDLGRVITRATAVVDLSGDSLLFSTPSGLVQVPCCDESLRTPAANASLVTQWVGGDGQPAAPVGPELWVERPPEGGLVVVRSDGGTEIRWPIPDIRAAERDVSLPVSLSDGGSAFWLRGDAEAPSVFYRLSANGQVHKYVLGENSPVLIRKSGEVVIFYGDSYYNVDSRPR